MSGQPVPLLVTDVAVVPADSVPHPAAAKHKRAGDPPVALTNQLSLAVLPGDEAEAYMDACEPAHVNYKSKRQYGQLYTFVRSRAPHDQRT